MTTTIEGTTVQQVTVLAVPVAAFTDLASAVVAACKDNTLPTLTGVRIEWGPAGVRMVATDRYRLAVTEYGGEVQYADSGAVLVPAKELQAYVKALPKPSRFGLPPVVLIRPEDGHVVFTCATSDGEFTHTIRTLDGEFPKWESLLPSTYSDMGPEGIAMNPKYLADVAKMPTSRNAPVRVRFTGGGSRPMVWDTTDALDSGVRWRYLLMPVRIAG